MSSKHRIMRVSGHQPVYLPWLGLFHKLYLSDVFVYMDTVQFLQGDWNNRNMIKTSQKPLMLTVPIDKKKSKNTNLNEIKIFNDNASTRNYWQKAHWESIKINYSKAPFFDFYKDEIEDMYLNKKWNYLVDLCWYQFNMFRNFLDLGNKKVVRMSEVIFEGKKDDLVLNHCEKLNGNAVIFGSLGKNYVNLEKFTKKKILVYFQDYHHPKYNQLYSSFVPKMCILDLLFNEGPELSKSVYLKNNITYEDLNNKSKWISN